MNGSRYYRVRVEGAKYGVGFASALAITISYSANHSILRAIIREQDRKQEASFPHVQTLRSYSASTPE